MCSARIDSWQQCESRFFSLWGAGCQVLLLPTESPVLEVSQLALLIKRSKTHSIGVSGESPSHGSSTEAMQAVACAFSQSSWEGLGASERMQSGWSPLFLIFY